MQIIFDTYLWDCGTENQFGNLHHTFNPAKRFAKCAIRSAKSKKSLQIDNRQSARGFASRGEGFDPTIFSYLIQISHSVVTIIVSETRTSTQTPGAIFEIT